MKEELNNKVKILTVQLSKETKEYIEEISQCRDNLRSVMGVNSCLSIDNDSDRITSTSFVCYEEVGMWEDILKAYNDEDFR